MSPIVRPYWLALLLGMAGLVQAQSHHALTVSHGGGGGHGHSGSMHGGPVVIPNSGGSSYQHGHPGFGGGYGYGFGGGFGYGAISSYNYYSYSYPLTVNYGVAIPFLYPVLVPQAAFTGGGGGGGGLMLPMPPQQVAKVNPAPAPAARQRNAARAKELVEIGDRSFRGRNIKRAEEKYLLAVKSDPTSPIPHIHLAQVSMVRGDYVAAADHLRDAVTVAAEAGWLLTTPDIQAIFAEPADFAHHLARLESHLQANPTDRDGWFVLGAEFYLSGRSKQANDSFERLTDRKADEALASFMDASKAKVPAAN